MKMIRNLLWLMLKSISNDGRTQNWQLLLNHTSAPRVYCALSDAVTCPGRWMEKIMLCHLMEPQPGSQKPTAYHGLPSGFRWQTKDIKELWPAPVPPWTAFLIFLGKYAIFKDFPLYENKNLINLPHEFSHGSYIAPSFHLYPLSFLEAVIFDFIFISKFSKISI